jgi:hypothetical protein
MSGAPVVLLLATIVWPTATFAADKTISVEHQHRDEPVLIYSVTVGNIEVQSGMVDGLTGYLPVVPFDGDANWLENASISLLNRTNKTIVYGSIALMFPETGDGTMQKPISTYNLTFGRIPDAAAFTGSGQPLRQPSTQLPASLLPGQTMTLSVAGQINLVKNSIVRIPFSAVTTCNIRRVLFFFDDGMKWDGRFYVPDAAYLGQWKLVAGRYFPGMPVWPPKF